MIVYPQRCGYVTNAQRCNMKRYTAHLATLSCCQYPVPLADDTAKPKLGSKWPMKGRLISFRRAVAGLRTQRIMNANPKSTDHYYAAWHLLRHPSLVDAALLTVVHAVRKDEFCIT